MFLRLSVSNSVHRVSGRHPSSADTAWVRDPPRQIPLGIHPLARKPSGQSPPSIPPGRLPPPPETPPCRHLPPGDTPFQTPPPPSWQTATAADHKLPTEMYSCFHV